MFYSTGDSTSLASSNANELLVSTLSLSVFYSIALTNERAKRLKEEKSQQVDIARREYIDLYYEYILYEETRQQWIIFQNLRNQFFSPLLPNYWETGKATCTYTK